MTATSSDGELVGAYVAEGSEAAFRALAHRHVDLVFATALRHTGNAALAQDITQQVFISLARKAPRLGGMQTLAGWLHRTTVLETKARVRAELRRKQREQTALEIIQVQSEGASPFAALLPLLDEALLELRESDRLALVLRFLEGRSLREVGTVLGVEEDAARKRVARALERVSEFFRKRGFTAAVGAGSAALLTSATQAAPAGLAGTVGSAALATGASGGGVNLLLFRLMALKKMQTAILCVALAAIPLLMQQRANAVAENEREAVAAQAATAEQREKDLEGRVAAMRREGSRAEQGVIDARFKVDALGAQLTNASANGKYRWDDRSPYLRLPKAAFGQMRLETAANLHGKLTDQIKEALLMTGDEANETQAAISHYLASYQMAEAKLITPTNANTDELMGHSADQTKVLDVQYAGSNEMSQLRQDFFGQVDATLGDERAGFFTNALKYWMPLTEDFNGISSSMAVYNFPFHAVFYQPSPGDSTMMFRVIGPHMMDSQMISAADMPDLFRPYLQSWLAQLQQQPSDGQ